MRVPLLILFSIMITLSFPSIANESSPYSVLEHLGNDLFSRIADNQQEINVSPDIMRVIVSEELMPFIDYRYSAFKILGKHLKKTTKEQREMFSKAMSYNLERTYTSALMNYKNQQVLFESEKPIIGHKIVAIKAQIIDTNKPTINLVFKMRINKKTKEWKVFDMVIEGISLLSAKKSELGKRISQYGIEQVTHELMSVKV